MFKRVLSFAGYVPAAEMAEAVQLRDELIVSLRDMTIARDELARRHTQLREQLESKGLEHETLTQRFDAASAHLDDLQARYDNIVKEYSADLRDWEARQVEWQAKESAHEIALEQLESANYLIAELQQQRPQMRLVRPEGENRQAGDAEDAPADDEIIVKAHTVEMSGRLIVVAFEGKTHWTLSVNDHLFKVPVHDRAFLDEGKPVCKGTVIRAEFSETTFRRRSDNEPYTTRSLERVLDVIPPAPQTTQPMFAEAPAASKGAL